MGRCSPLLALLCINKYSFIDWANFPWASVSWVLLRFDHFVQVGKLWPPEPPGGSSQFLSLFSPELKIHMTCSQANVINHTERLTHAWSPLANSDTLVRRGKGSSAHHQIAGSQRTALEKERKYYRTSPQPRQTQVLCIPKVSGPEREHSPDWSCPHCQKENGPSSD